MVARTRIPESLYLGIRCYHNATTPVGFMAPHSDSKDFARRKQAIDRWAVRSTYIKSAHTSVIENVPLSGFALCSGLRSHHDAFSVRDPRGFNIPIAHDNANYLLSNCVIDHGEIQGRCLYGRNGQANLLLVEGTAEHAEAITFTALQDKRVSIRDVAPGNWVHLTNGLKAQYLGALYPIMHGDTGFVYPEHKTHHFHIRDGDLDTVHVCKLANISLVTDRSSIAPGEAEEIIMKVRKTATRNYDTRVRLPYQYVCSTSRRLSNRLCKVELEPANHYQVRDSYRPGISYTVLGSDDEVNYYRTSSYSFDSAFKQAQIECMKIDYEALLSHGQFTYFKLNTSRPMISSNLFTSLFGNDVERKVMSITKTNWFFVHAVIRNPATGTTMRFRL